MEQQAVGEIFSAMQNAGAQYLVAVGLAVIAHGYFRFTADVDLIVVLSPENLKKVGDALAPLGYAPRVPEPIGKLGEVETRRRWADEKNMVVFSLVSARYPLTVIDLFIEEPFDFQEALSRALWLETMPGLQVPFVSYEDLLLMKHKAGRDKDLLDIHELQSIRRDS